MDEARLGRLRQWYADKQEGIVRKYGRGGLVHFHTGLPTRRWQLDDPAFASLETAEIQAALFTSQEAMLDRAFAFWELDAHASRGERVLDVGCGLGGTSLVLAQRGFRVTGLSISAENLARARRLAEDEGQQAEARGTPYAPPRFVVGDADTYVDPEPFDKFVCFGASNYFDKAAWFSCLSRMAMPGARLLIEDSFLPDEDSPHAADASDVEARFNDYWDSRVASERVYVEAAAACGWVQTGRRDVSTESAAFWSLSVEYYRRHARPDDEGLARSITFQRWLFDVWAKGGLPNRWLSFRRQG